MIKTCVICGKEFDARRRAVSCPACRPLYSTYVPLPKWLTIPDAPNYEINGNLVVRNKRTGKILKLCVVPHRRTYYSLRPPGWKHTLKRSPETLRRQAIEAARPKKSFPLIPSLGGRYEIDNRGIVRNSLTKKILKIQRGCIYVFDNCGKFIVRSVNDLLWEVHGIIKKRRSRIIPCYAENKHGKYSFPSAKACARFLAPKLYYSVGRVASFLYKRTKTLGEWTITYLNQNPTEVKWDICGLGALARRQQKLEGSS